MIIPQKQIKKNNNDYSSLQPSILKVKYSNKNIQNSLSSSQNNEINLSKKRKRIRLPFFDNSHSKNDFIEESKKKMKIV